MNNLEFTPQELEAIRAEYCKGATDTQFELFISECRNRSLRPGAHLVFQLRNAKEWDADTGASRYVKKPYWITTIGALLLIAERTGKYDGASAPEYIYLDENSEPSVVSDIPLPDKQNKHLPREPWAVRVKIRRKDFSEPIVSVVRFDSVAATQKRGESLVLTDMWVKRGPEQNAKCSLANGIRICFPEDAGHLFLTEEIKNEEEEKPQPAAVTPASVTPPPSAPKVSQVPVQGTETPRPNEETKIESPKVFEKVGGGIITEEEVTKTEKQFEEGVKRTQEAPKKRGPKPKNPVNGQPPVEGITDQDIASLSEPKPEEVDQAPAAQEFVESLDPTPTKEERAAFIERIRTLTKKGIAGKSIQARILELAKPVTDHNLAPKRYWEQALEELEKPDASVQPSSI